jgi:uncharacterized LabA/DUF88 family protein
VPPEPQVKRAVAFIDAQNLFHAAREAFGCRYPNFDAVTLSGQVCAQRGWRPEQVRLYTGVPAQTDNPFWSHFWTAKLAQMGRDGVVTYSRALRYRNQTVRLPGGQEHTILVGQEKGIDIRIALDIVRLAHQRAYDVALVFSQDQDLSEVADELRVIAQEQRRWIKIASAYPWSPTSRNARGINKSDWLRIERALYEACLDPRDYRPKASSLTSRAE